MFEYPRKYIEHSFVCLKKCSENIIFLEPCVLVLNRAVRIALDHFFFYFLFCSSCGTWEVYSLCINVSRIWDCDKKQQLLCWPKYDELCFVILLTSLLEVHQELMNACFVSVSYVHKKSFFTIKNKFFCSAVHCQVDRCKIHYLLFHSRIYFLMERTKVHYLLFHSRM